MGNPLKDAIEKTKNQEKRNSSEMSLVIEAVVDEFLSERKKEIISEMSKLVVKEVDKAEKLIREVIKKWEKDNQKFKGERGLPGLPGRTPRAEVDYPIPKDGKTATRGELIEIIKPLIPKVKNGETPSRKYLLSIIEPLIPTVKDGSPDRAEDIVKKLESLTGESRLDKSAIKGLSEEFRAIANNIRERSNKNVGGGGDSLLLYNLSPYLNGATKTFTIPAHRKILGFFQSAAPFGAFAPTTDFTHTRTSITFTSQVDETTALLGGQALLILYSR